MAGILTHLRRLKNGCLDALSSRFTRWTKPLGTSLPLSTLTDLSRSKSELMAENALLRKPLIILKRQVKWPACTKTDRLLLVLLARMVRTWKQTLLIVQEDDIAAASIGNSFVWSGSIGQRLLLTNRRSPQKPSRFLRQMAKDNRRLRC